MTAVLSATRATDRRGFLMLCLHSFAFASPFLFFQQSRNQSPDSSAKTGIQASDPEGYVIVGGWVLREFDLADSAAPGIGDAA